MNETKTMILYPEFLENQALRLAASHRASGMEVACVRFGRDNTLDQYKEYGKRAHFGGIVYLQAENETFAINLSDGGTQPIDITRFMA